MAKLIWKLPVMAVCLVFGVAYALELTERLTAADWETARMAWFAGGVAVMLPLWLLVFRRAGFFSTFEHELTHLLVGLLFLKKPHSFNVHHQSGGHVQMYGGNFLITLAPYFLPTLVLIQLPFFLLLRPEFYPAFFGVMGLLTGFTVFSGIQEFHLKQPDIRQSGIIFSIVVILFGNVFFLGGILVFVLEGFPGWWAFIRGGGSAVFSLA